MKQWRLSIRVVRYFKTWYFEKFWRGIERATSLNKSSLTWRGGCSAPLKLPRLKYSHFEDFSVTLQQIWLHAKVATWTTFNWVPWKMLNNSCKAKALSCLKLEFYERGNFTLFAWEEPRWIGCPGVLHGSVSLGMTSGRGYPLRSLPSRQAPKPRFRTGYVQVASAVRVCLGVVTALVYTNLYGLQTVSCLTTQGLFGNDSRDTFSSGLLRLRATHLLGYHRTENANEGNPTLINFLNQDLITKFSAVLNMDYRRDQGRVSNVQILTVFRINWIYLPILDCNRTMKHQNTSRPALRG